MEGNTQLSKVNGFKGRTHSLSGINTLLHLNSMDSLAVTLEFLDVYIKKHDFTTKPLVVGVSGPQGSGKLYLSFHLQEALALRYPQYQTIQFLMDDLYLTHKDQQTLNLSTSNPLLHGRGLPGTHDLALSESILKRIQKGDHPLQLPVYDKLRFNGEGDRSEESVDVQLVANIVVFEGWFNGYLALDDDQIKLAYFQNPELWVFKLFDLEEVNKYLKLYHNIWCQFDVLVNIKADNITDNVARWRVQQEHHLISKTGVGMTDEQIKFFLRRYMPLYTLYYESLCDSKIITCPTLQLQIDSNRTLTSHAIKNGAFPQHQNL